MSHPLPTPQRGFQHDPDADPQQWIALAGDAYERIQPDHDWRPWRQETEIQNQNGFDPLSCASYGNIKLICRYLYRVYGVQKNYSERWLAYKTGTYDKQGNDPHYVFEYIRLHGLVEEWRWPFKETIRTIVEYYYPPDAALDDIANDFNKEWKLWHWTVKGGAQAIWDALVSSPVGLSLGYNSVDENGYWYKNGNHNDSHWAIADHGEEGKYIGVDDSAEPRDKKLAWDKLNPQLAKRIKIDRRLPSDRDKDILDKLAQLLRIASQWLGLIAASKSSTPPTPPIQPVEPPQPPEPTPEPPKSETMQEMVLRVCKEKGLTDLQTKELYATVYCESQFNPKAINRNVGKNGKVLSTDYGISQINDYYHIGVGKGFPDFQYVLDNPEACIRWMCDRWKEGNARLWACFSKELYKRYL